MRILSLSTYASKPQAASQLKQMVGISEEFFLTRFGHCAGSNSVQSSQRFDGGKLARPEEGDSNSCAAGFSGRLFFMPSLTQRSGLPCPHPHVFKPEQAEQCQDCRQAH